MLLLYKAEALLPATNQSPKAVCTYLECPYNHRIAHLWHEYHFVQPQQIPWQVWGKNKQCCVCDLMTLWDLGRHGFGVQKTGYSTACHGEIKLVNGRFWHGRKNSPVSSAVAHSNVSWWQSAAYPKQSSQQNSASKKEHSVQAFHRWPQPSNIIVGLRLYRRLYRRLSNCNIKDERLVSHQWYWRWVAISGFCIHINHFTDMVNSLFVLTIGPRDAGLYSAWPRLGLCHIQQRRLEVWQLKRDLPIRLSHQHWTLDECGLLGICGNKQRFNQILLYESGSHLRFFYARIIFF